MQRHWQDSCWRVALATAQVATVAAIAAIRVAAETPSHQVTYLEKAIKLTEG